MPGGFSPLYARMAEAAGFTYVRRQSASTVAKPELSVSSVSWSRSPSTLLALAMSFTSLMSRPTHVIACSASFQLADHMTSV